MPKFTIYFHDLSDATRQAIWYAVQRDLLNRGGIAERGEEESEEAFEERIADATDHHINCYNVGNEFCL